MFCPFKADRYHEGVENGTAGRVDIIACQFVCEDGVVGLGLVRVILRDDMIRMVPHDDSK